MRAQRVLFVFLAMLAAVPAFAQPQSTGTNTQAATLSVNVTVVKAIRLTLDTGTQCTVSGPVEGPPNYTMSFGTVDALAITAVTCGAKFAPTTPGLTPAVYYSDYKLKPVFTSQDTANNVIRADVSTNFATAAGLLAIVQSNTAPGAIGDLTAMTVGAAIGSQTLVDTNAASATEITRYIGVSVAPINGAGTLTGAASATITYTLIVS